MTQSVKSAPAIEQAKADELQALNAQLETASAHERIAWAAQAYGEGLVMSTSFGVQAAVLLHMANEVVPGIPVIFIDTGYLFAETYKFADELEKRLKLNLKTYAPLRTPARQEALEGKRWELGLEGLKDYNFENKVEPMNRAVRELSAAAWLSGLRRAQSSSRGGLQVVQPQNRISKIYPIIDWSDRDVYNYLTANNLPYHPLWDDGYVSVGDWHSTTRLGAGMTAEETRFGGLKRECGLHELSNRPDFQI